MKRIIKLAFVFMLAFSLVGCGEKDATADQEKVVNQFFESIKKGDMDKLEKICTSDYSDEVGFADLASSYDDFLDDDLYGKEFTKEAQKLVDATFENLIDEYKIKDIKEKDDKTIVKVTGKRLDTDMLSEMDINDEATEIMEDYQSENEDLIKQIYEEDGQEAVMKKVMADIGKELFGLMIEKIEEADKVDFTLEFVLVKEKGDWKIEEIVDKDEKSTSKKDDEEDEVEMDSYTVDAKKLKADATLLKKGRLEESTYLAEKTIETDLEFIDYNVINGSGVELDKYDMIDTTNGKLKFETEIHGNKGSKVIIVISDDRNVISKDEYTLEDVKQVFTKELEGIDANAKYFGIDIYVAGSYDEEYDYGDKVGSYFISKAE